MSSSPPKRPRSRSELLCDLTLARHSVSQLEAELSALSPNPNPHLPPAPTALVDGGETGIKGVEDEESIGGKVGEGKGWRWPLSRREYGRYGRQMMLSGVGLPGQLALKNAHILVVGAGGLGCPVLLYLAAAGVGEITILDHDTVELSNLHRQVLHTEGRVGCGKAESAKAGLQALNSDISIHSHSLAFTPSLFHSSTCPPSLRSGSFTLVLDCTDNPSTRHFLNSYCVAHRIPLASGGAVRAEGTVGAYGVPLKPTPSAPSPGTEEEQQYGPCYACIFPPSPSPPSLPIYSTPPSSAAEKAERERLEDQYYERLSLAGSGACSDEGVLGVLCGVVGVGMAAEAIKVLLGTAQPSLHLFSPLSSSPYRSIKARSRKPTCAACGSFPLPSSSSSTPSSATAGVSTPASRWADFLLSPTGEWEGWVDPLCEVPGVGALSVGGGGREDTRVRVEELRLRREKEGGRTKVVDTRSPAEFGIAKLEGSVNIPFPRLLRDPSLALSSAPSLSASSQSSSSAAPSSPAEPPIDRLLFVCRRGNDSLLASRAVRRYLARQAAEGSTGVAEEGEGGRAKKGEVQVEDLVGGLQAWAAAVEGEEGGGFPRY